MDGREEKRIRGFFLTGEGFVEGEAACDGAGRVISFRKKKGVLHAVSGESLRYLPYYLPSFINAHIHLGDGAFFGEDIKGTIEEIFRPPHGLKHRLLRNTEEGTLVDGMKRVLWEARKTGTGAVFDFREGGMEGIKLLLRAVKALEREKRPVVLILGRPDDALLHQRRDKSFSFREMEGEIKSLASVVHGLGLPSADNYTSAERRFLSAFSDELGLVRAVHAFEECEEPLSPIRELSPHLLIHLSHAPKEVWKWVKETGAGAVLCCRSNLRFTKPPDMRAALESGVPLMVGTDNAMFQNPSVKEEARCLRGILLEQIGEKEVMSLTRKSTALLVLSLITIIPREWVLNKAGMMKRLRDALNSQISVFFWNTTGPLKGFPISEILRVDVPLSELSTSTGAEEYILSHEREYFLS